LGHGEIEAPLTGTERLGIVNLQALQWLMGTEQFKMLFIVSLFLLLLLFAARLLGHSIENAIKIMKSAFKNEFKTDAGRLNLLSLVLYIFLAAFFNVDKIAAIALNPSHSDSDQMTRIVVFFLFCLLASGSFVCVAILECKTQDPAKKGNAPSGDGPPPTNK